jgi:hypothetical protein
MCGNTADGSVTNPFGRLVEAVNALAEVNYSGNEFESMIDELGDTFTAYRAEIG